MVAPTSDSIPIYRSPAWHALPPDDPRRRRSTVRAADAWFNAHTDEVIASRVADECALADLLARWRIREAGLDVHGRGDTDWVSVHEVATARAEYLRRWGVAC